MPRMDGKTVVVTGATSGIGLVTAEKLAASGASLVLIGRDKEKGEALRARLRAVAPANEPRLEYADLSRLSEVRRLAGALAALPRIDVLLNNAGAFFARRAVTEDGLERTFALNHMAYFVLTALLLDRLKASAPARVVSVASEAHRGATLDFADLQLADDYSGWNAYRRSKLCNILFTRELSRRLSGTGVTANCLHPGFVASSFGDNNGGLVRLGLGLAKRLAAISPERGAETPVYLASAPEVAGTTGAYFDKCRAVAPAAAAQDDPAAARLWQESARLAGLPR
jgi:NAD(P)-dependent dehydrogenase (short-subunit alcohol dehydrogenase family)